jgi:cytochrome c553
VRSAFPIILIGIAVVAGAPAATAEPAAAPHFVLACAPCHGFDGIGYDKSIPNLAGQRQQYLYDQLLAFRRGQRGHPYMSFFSGQMTQEELQQIADYYSSLPPP